MAKQRTADAYPQKDFLIHQLTRDISLNDCILDLIDNSVDGVHNYFYHSNKAFPKSPKPYRSHWVRVRFSEHSFTIEDNCEGIPVAIAEKYAFTFGRAQDEPFVPGTIGRYGIGLKRAIFKIGNIVDITSSTRDESFTLHLDVDEWGGNPTDWKFPIVVAGALNLPGTRITVTQLRPQTADEFSRPLFEGQFKVAVRRDYSFILSKGFSISVNDQPVSAEHFSFKATNGFVPYKVHETYKSVDIDIVAGLSAPQPEDSSPGVTIKDTDRYGWFVICNDRVVLGADKSRKTGWGTDGAPAWHSQYNGFCGIARLYANDPRNLPWTTTKRDLDLTNPVLQHMLELMRFAMSEYKNYTNDRKGRESIFHEREQKAKEKPLDDLPLSDTMKFPATPPITAEEKWLAIYYWRPESQVKKVATALGRPSMPAKQVGERTFDDYLKRKIGAEG